MVVALPTPEDLAGVLTRSPQVVDTAAGPMEYAEAGEGSPLLFAHGALGGYDQGLGMTALFWLNGFRVIAPSRPGYLGTPLRSGATVEEQGDALAGLLDALGIDRVAAMGFSGGGPPSYALAARHPDRVCRLVEISSPATAYEMNPVLMKAALSRVGSGVYAWLLRTLLQHVPEAAIRNFLQDETTLEKDEITALARRILKDPYRAAFVTQVWAARVRRVAERLPGTRNDLAQNATLTGLPLSDVACPTLIVQSHAPEPTRHAQHAAATLRQAEVRWLRDGCHIGLWLNDDALEQQQHVLSWLRRNSSAGQ